MTGEPVIGLVVNPVAGLGGAAGLKGSDGAAAQRAALARGAVPRAGERAARAVRALLARRPGARLVTVPGPMGEDAVRAAGGACDLVRLPSPPTRPTGNHPPTTRRTGGPTDVGRLNGGQAGGGTTAEDTRRAVAALGGVDLLLFAGGDGTARDVLDALRELGDQAPPVLGVPAGVKVYSGCFAVSPATAGLVAAAFRPGSTGEAEVVDLDEDGYRRGLVGPRLYGTVRVPEARTAYSGRKTGSSGTPPATVGAIAREVVSRMRPGVRYVLGPGATTRAVGHELGLGTTLLGVDVVGVDAAGEGRLIAADVPEARLFGLVGPGKTVVVLSVIGGQGFVLGRGNQQISPRVLRAAGATLLVLATQPKLAALKGRPLLADSGDEDLDRTLSGHVRVITGHRESTIYRLSAASEEYDG